MVLLSLSPTSRLDMGETVPGMRLIFQRSVGFENYLNISDCVLSILPFDSREGSVVAEFLLEIGRGTSTDFEGMLQNAINNKQFGNAVVESFSEVKGLFWKSMEKRPLSPHICLFVCLGF